MGAGIAGKDSFDGDIPIRHDEGIPGYLQGVRNDLPPAQMIAGIRGDLQGDLVARKDRSRSGYRAVFTLFHRNGVRYSGPDLDKFLRVQKNGDESERV